MIPVTLTEDQMKLKIDDLNFIDEDVFIMETKKEGHYVFKQDRNMESSEEEEKKGASYSNYNRYGNEENKREREPPE